MAKARNRIWSGRAARADLLPSLLPDPVKLAGQ
jgi:hypothetical protein